MENSLECEILQTHALAFTWKARYLYNRILLYAAIISSQPALKMQGFFPCGDNFHFSVY